MVEDHKPEASTAAWKLFHYFYMCSLPELYTYNRNAEAIFGRITTEDAQYDMEIAKGRVYKHYNIAQMAEYFAEGAPLALVKPEESVEIFELIKEHIDEWNQHIQQPFIQVDAPMDDLKKLEEFGNAIWELARFEKPQHLGDIGLSGATHGYGERVSSAFFGVNAVKRAVPTHGTTETAPLEPGERSDYRVGDGDDVTW